MKRWIALFLICLLPVQVFAGMLAFKVDIQPIMPESPIAQWQQIQTAAIDAGIGLDFGDQQTLLVQADDEDGNTSYAESDDLSGHAGVGDDTVLNPSMAFVADSTGLAPALRSDDSTPSPFLPPAGRPPRV